MTHAIVRSFAFCTAIRANGLTLYHQRGDPKTAEHHGRVLQIPYRGLYPQTGNPADGLGSPGSGRVAFGWGHRV